MATFEFNSPEQEIHFPLFKEKNVRVFVKRDDLIHPFISGNKWRKLKYMISFAKEQNKDTLVTFGGAWSNHLVATACAGANFGYRTYGFVRGDEVENPVLALCKLFGMTLHFVSRSDYQDKHGLYNNVFGNRPRSLFINEGGYSKEAVRGCSELIDELETKYDNIICAAGTGATAAGLQTGISNHPIFQKETSLHVIPVLKGGDFIKDEINKLDVDSSLINFHLDYHFGGYAKVNAQLLNFIKCFVNHTDIMIEPTYTGKLFYALFDLIKNGLFQDKSKILAIHSGGLTGFLGMFNKFYRLLSF